MTDCFGCGEVKQRLAVLERKYDESIHRMDQMLDQNSKLIDLLVNGKKADEESKKQQIADHVNKPLCNSESTQTDSSDSLVNQSPAIQSIDLTIDISEYNIPNWLIDVLAFIPRIEMANSSLLSFSCKLFYQLTLPKLHGDVQPHIVCPMVFYSKEDELGNRRAILKWNKTRELVPIASVPPPDYITGFAGIDIRFFNGQVFQFMQCISNKLQQFDVHFGMRLPQFSYLSPERIAKIYQLFELLAGKTFSVQFIRDNFLCDFNQFYAKAEQFFGQVRRVETKFDEYNLDFLLKWIITRREDGKPKFFTQIDFSWLTSKFIDRIKEQFTNDGKAVNFYIKLSPDHRIEEFNLINEETAEILALYRNGADIYLIRSENNQNIREIWEKELRRDLEGRFSKIEIKIDELGNFCN